MSSERLQVGIHANAYPVPSEAFITEQARALDRYTPLMLVRRQLAPSEIPCLAIQRGEQGLLRRRMFALAPGAWAWNDRHALSRLALVHSHFGANGVYGARVARGLRIPSVLTFHGNDATVRTAEILRSQGVAGWAYVLGFKSLVRHAAACLAVSKFLARQLLELGVPERNLIQHYIGVDVTRFQPCDDAERTHDIVCVARLVREKGIGDLIHAFSTVASRVPDARLRLIGVGRDRDEFMAQAARTAFADRIVFEGAMSHVAVAAIVRRAALSVLASRTGDNGWQEAFGLASIEAAACGVPVIVTRTGGLAESVEDGVTGRVVPEAQPGALADAMLELMLDAGTRQRLGRAGRERVVRDFNLKLQTHVLERIYDDAVSR